MLRFETRNIIVNIPLELLERVNEAAKLEWMSRSEYIRFILGKELKDKTIEVLLQAQAEKIYGDKELEDFLREYNAGKRD
ncbi:MAG: hypothetical protein AAB436_03430 [Patescibacteria group bacterium]